jgi:hypothetical protein
MQSKAAGVLRLKVVKMSASWSACPPCHATQRPCPVRSSSSTGTSRPLDTWQPLGCCLELFWKTVVTCMQAPIMMDHDTLEGLTMVEGFGEVQAHVLHLTCAESTERPHATLLCPEPWLRVPVARRDHTRWEMNGIVRTSKYSPCMYMKIPLKISNRETRVKV